MSIFVGTPSFFRIKHWVAVETMEFHITKMDIALRTQFLVVHLNKLACIGKWPKC